MTPSIFVGNPSQIGQEPLKMSVKMCFFLPRNVRSTCFSKISYGLFVQKTCTVKKNLSLICCLYFLQASAFNSACFKSCLYIYDGISCLQLHSDHHITGSLS